MKKLILTLILTIIFVVPCAAAADDQSDRLSQESSYTFSPGYINAAKYQAESLLRVNLPDVKKKGFFENALDYVKNKLGRKTETQAPAQQVNNPELQKKTSGTNPAKVSAAGAQSARLIDSTQYNVDIGTGTDQRDINGELISVSGGRMVSEVFVIDGREVRHIYVGDYKGGTVGISGINEALNKAADGDILLVTGDIYNIYNVINKEVKIYGGYNEEGIRDIANTPSTIWQGSWLTDINKQFEINGFNIAMDPEFGGIGIRNSSNITIVNNTFFSPEFQYGAQQGIMIENSSVVVRNNIFNDTTGMAIADQSAVISADNNFNGGYGMSITGGNPTISSTGDYFSDLQLNPWGQGSTSASFSDVRIDPNTGTYSTKLNLGNIEASGPLTTTLSQEYYLSDSDLFRNSYDYVSKNTNYEETSSILSNLLANKNNLMPKGGAAGEIDQSLLAKIVDDALGKGIFALSMNGATREQQAVIARALAKILTNPTDDQKVVIDSITSLLADMNNVANQADPELKKASDELLQAVANLLLAQAIPDLLKSGDIANIKGIFSNLDSSKTKMILEYNESTKPYYDEVKKMIQRNAEALQLSNVLQKNLMQKEMEELPRSEIDKIIEKLKAKSKKTTEEAYILQQAAKYKQKYVEPNKKKLEENMKAMLQEFTKKLSATLEATKK